MTDAFRIVRDAPLDRRNTFGVAACAQVLAEVRDAAALGEVLSSPDFASTAPLVLGGGSNLLFAGNPGQPVLAVRLQELFGLAETPRVGGGAVPVTLHLLSPAGRPVQVTRDLAGFWRNTYFDVRKDLKGRYPKHDWPDNPLGAEPTSRAKRRM